MAKTPKGELTSAEIRKLIRGHNKLVNIKVPTGLDRDGLIKFLKSKKFEVDHKNKRLVDKSPSRGKSVSLETAKSITKPKPKTALQKQKAEEAKAEKAEKKKKEERVIRKKAVEEEKARSKPKAKPKPKTASIAVGTEAPKKEKDKFGYLPFKKKLDKAVEVSGKNLDNLTKKSKERLAKIEQELKDGTNKRETQSIKIETASRKPTGSAVPQRGNLNLVIKFGLNEGEELTRATQRKIPKAMILPFEKSKN